MRRNQSTYSDDHENTQVDENTAGISDPIGDDFGLFHRQIVADPSKIGEQMDNLRTSRQCRSEKLAQAQWEVQSGDEERNQTGINKTTRIVKIK